MHQEDDAVYCDICYTNEITKPGDPVSETDTSTVELVCEHRFCSECVVADMKHHIENAEMDKIKCLSFDCQKAMSKAKVESILKAQGEDALFNKYERFLAKKTLEADLLVRWCPKAGCEDFMRAENGEVKKLTCPTCSTEVCF